MIVRTTARPSAADPLLITSTVCRPTSVPSSSQVSHPDPLLALTTSIKATGKKNEGGEQLVSHTYLDSGREEQAVVRLQCGRPWLAIDSKTHCACVERDRATY